MIAEECRNRANPYIQDLSIIQDRRFGTDMTRNTLEANFRSRTFDEYFVIQQTAPHGMEITDRWDELLQIYYND